MSQTYFLSAKVLSPCEHWYWKTYTDILYEIQPDLAYDSFDINKKKLTSYVIYLVRSNVIHAHAHTNKLLPIFVFIN